MLRFRRDFFTFGEIRVGYWLTRTSKAIADHHPDKRRNECDQIQFVSWITGRKIGDQWILHDVEIHDLGAYNRLWVSTNFSLSLSLASRTQGQLAAVIAHHYIPRSSSLFRLRRSVANDFQKALRFERRTANERAIDVRASHEFGGVVRLHAATVLDADAGGGVLAVEFGDE